MAQTCKRCGSDRPVMCAGCVEDLANRYDRRTRAVQQAVGQLAQISNLLREWVADPAAAQRDKDDG